MREIPTRQWAALVTAEQLRADRARNRMEDLRSRDIRQAEHEEKLFASAQNRLGAGLERRRGLQRAPVTALGAAPTMAGLVPRPAAAPAEPEPARQWGEPVTGGGAPDRPAWGQQELATFIQKARLGMPEEAYTAFPGAQRGSLKTGADGSMSWLSPEGHAVSLTKQQADSVVGRPVTHKVMSEYESGRLALGAETLRLRKAELEAKGVLTEKDKAEIGKINAEIGKITAETSKTEKGTPFKPPAGLLRTREMLIGARKTLSRALQNYSLAAAADSESPGKEADILLPDGSTGTITLEQARGVLNANQQMVKGLEKLIAEQEAGPQEESEVSLATPSAPQSAPRQKTLSEMAKEADIASGVDRSIPIYEKTEYPSTITKGGKTLDVKQVQGNEPPGLIRRGGKQFSLADVKSEVEGGLPQTTAKADARVPGTPHPATDSAGATAGTPKVNPSVKLDKPTVFTSKNGKQYTRNPDGTVVWLER